MSELQRSPADPIRIVIADDEALVRSGLRLLLDGHPDLTVVGEASDGRAAIRVARTARADLVLMDIRMPVLDGLAAASELLAQEHAPQIIMLTTFGEDEYVYQAMRIGTSGFLLKAAPPEALLHAIRIVSQGQALIDPAVTKRVIEAFGRRGPPPEPVPALDELTSRELEVLLLIARGLSNAEIGASLVISVATVKTHVNRVLMKLGLRDRVQAVVLAYEAGLVDRDA